MAGESCARPSDLRDKHDLRFVYNAEILVPEEDEPRILKRAVHSSPPVEAYREPSFEMPAAGTEPLRHRPVVIGSGPGGLIAATSSPSKATARSCWNAAHP